MNLFQKILGALGFGQNEPEQYQTYETPKADPRFKGLDNPETPRRKPQAHKVEREAEKPAAAPRKPTAHAVDGTVRRTTQDDYLYNPVANPALWPVLFGNTTPAKADDAPVATHHQPSSDFGKAADDTPAPAPSHDSGSSSSYDSGSSSSSYDSGSSSSSYDSGSSSSSFDSGGGGGGFDGGGGASFAPEWR